MRVPAAAAGRREEDASALSAEDVEARCGAARRLLLLVDKAGLSGGLDESTSLVARRFRVCRGAGGMLFGAGGSGPESGAVVDVLEAADEPELLSRVLGRGGADWRAPARLVGGDGAKGGGPFARRSDGRLLFKDHGEAKTERRRRGRGTKSKGSWVAQCEKELALWVGIKEEPEVLYDEECAGRVEREETGGW